MLLITDGLGMNTYTDNDKQLKHNVMQRQVSGQLSGAIAGVWQLASGYRRDSEACVSRRTIQFVSHHANKSYEIQS